MRFLARLSALSLLAALLTFGTAGTGAPGAARFGDVEMRALLRENPVTGKPIDSIEELVPLLPAELRSNVTFVYESRSPFRSSITRNHPRTILFTRDGRFILTFTGDPNRPGADVLETMSFDDVNSRFNLTAYRLPAAVRRGDALPRGAGDCASCHGADPRPIYDSYPLWPGFYGSVLDTFPHDKLGRAELADYLVFRGTTARTGVYRWLLLPDSGPTTPYLDPRHFRENSVKLDDRTFPFLPNTRLGMALTELNRARIYRKVNEGPGFAANEKRILAVLLECRARDRPSTSATREIEARVARENVARVKRMGATPGPTYGLRDMQELDFGRELAAIDAAAALAGVDRSDWSMAMERGSLAFFDGILSGMYAGKNYYLKEDLIYEILSHLAARDPEFRPYFGADAVFAEIGYPFGARVRIGAALASCPLLATPNARSAIR